MEIVYLQGFQKRTKMAYPPKTGKGEETNTRMSIFEG
jgi:hypothetical protein